MHAMGQEMQQDEHGLIGEVVVEVEEEAVEGVLEDGPDEVAEEEACEGLGPGVERDGGEGGEGERGVGGETREREGELEGRAEK